MIALHYCHVRARNFLRRGTGSPQSQSQQFKWDWMGLGLLDSELVGLGTSFQPLAVGLDWTRTFRNSQSVGLDWDFRTIYSTGKF